MGESQRSTAPNVATIRDFRKAHEMFEAHVGNALEVLLEVMNNDEADHGHRIAAAKEIITRARGQAPSFQVVQGIIQHDHKVSVDPAALQNMDSEQLAALEGTLTRLLSAPEAIDHEK